MLRTDIALENYEAHTRALGRTPGTTEETYYPHLRQLFSAALDELGLTFEVRTGTSEVRPGRGRDRPDLVVADGPLVAVYGEVKTPSVNLTELAVSVERDDQVGRYLARTGVVLLCNISEVGLLLCRPGVKRAGCQKIDPADRELVRVAPLWRPSSLGRPTDSTCPLLELLELALLDCAPIAEPATLARVLALQAKAAKADLPNDLRGLERLLEDYREALGLSFNIDEDAGREFFRSTLIQTAFYGLFAAWALWQRENDATEFSWDRVNRYLRIPFLAGLFHEFRNPTRLHHLNLERHLDRATETLNRVDLSIFRERMTFPSASGSDATSIAMTYFYEPFLEAFDPELKKTMGVWYTPPEVVRYQVRRAHTLLKEQLGRPLGLADDNVVLLDPCCGTGAYLLEAARCIADEFRENGDGALVGLSLLRALTSRVFGFELLTAPFAIAQLQLYVMLSDLRAPPPNDQRLGVFLTNALTGWRDKRSLRLNFPELQMEYDAAQAVKHDADIVVVLGNPPYDRQAAVRMDEEAGLVDHYKGVSFVDRRQADGSLRSVTRGTTLLFREWGVRKQLLNDLYVRFHRLAEREIGEDHDCGLVSLITNSSWLTGRSHPIMRESLLRNFHEVWIDNLNGDKYRTGKVIPQGIPGAGSSDQSIFTTEADSRGIQTGVAIGTFLKRGAERTAPEDTVVHYRDFWGRAELKRRQLLDDTVDTPAYSLLSPSRGNRWRLAPHSAAAGYDAWPSLEEIFPTRVQGVNPNRGLVGSLIDTHKDVLWARMKDYVSAPNFSVAAMAFPALAEKRAGYDPEGVWRELRRLGVDPHKMKPYLLFPFDQRWIYYENRTKLLNRPPEGMGANLDGAYFLIAVPEPRKVSEARPLFARTLLDLHVHDRGSVAIPATIAPNALVGMRVANLAPEVWQVLQSAWGVEGRLSDSVACTCAQDLVHIALAIMHAPAYGQEHASALSADWARLPVPRTWQLAQQVSGLGKAVAELLDPTSDPTSLIENILGKDVARLMAAPNRIDGRPISAADLRVTVSYFGAASGRFVQTNGNIGQLWLNENVYISNVPVSTWSKELGGYQVIRKWLGYRQANRNNGTPLTLDEQKWLRSMILRLSALESLETRLDDAYALAVADAASFGEPEPYAGVAAE